MELSLSATESPFLQLAALVAGTFVSEDLTCITAGMLTHEGRLALPIALTGCWLGILLGDLGLWLVGRVAGSAVLRWSWVRRRLPARQLDELSTWFDRNGLAAVFAARFLPGTRLPIYLLAGALGRRVGRFALWAFLAGLVWTPLLVGLVAVTGHALLSPAEALTGSGWLSIILTVLLLFGLLRLLPQLFGETGRARLRARVERLWRWEFWPTWMFYLPVLPWIAYQAARFGGLRTITAANPGIPHGGVVGESKFAILSKLPPEWIIPSALLPAAPPEERLARLDQLMAERGWAYPLVLKPDAGQRGASLRRITSREQALAWLSRHAPDLLVQPYHPGPYEVGIFYVRRPEEAHGRILSITEKRFPLLVGDGVSTVARLIWRHPRYRMQAETFLARLNGEQQRVLAEGECLPLTIAGNHCQGSMFLDGGPLWSAALEARLDEIARSFPGFCFGRFDLRYADPQELRAGRGFAIVELNGATSESTNIYDPRGSLWRAYRTLFQQWSLLFEIGAANRQRGAPASTLSEVWREIRRHYRTRCPDLLAD